MTDNHSRRMVFGTKEDRVDLIQNGTRWLVRIPGKVKGENGGRQFPGMSVIVERLDRIQGIPLQEWRVTYCYESGKSGRSNSSVDSFLTGFRREDEVPLADRPDTGVSPGQTVAQLNAIVTRLHHRVINLEGLVRAMREELGIK